MYGHAIVIGGSIAGLATAKGLRRQFARVTLLERDSLSDGAEARAGVPQGRQFHVLLRRGQDVLEELFPGFSAELEASGAERLRWGRDVRWYHFGGWKQPNDSSFDSLFGSRLLVESVARRRLRETSGVEVVDGVTAEGLEVERGRARAVRVSGRGPLEADLIVDASGRQSKAPAWLAAHGFAPPVEQVVNANLGYASRVYRRPKGKGTPWRCLVVHATPPHHARIGAIMPIEGERWSVVLCGVNGDHPPTDEAGFLEFARGFPSPELHEALRGAEPAGPIHGYRRTANRLLRYDRLPRHLGRFVVLGDAVCAFNPVYAQGMTTATISARLLAETVAHVPLDDLAPAFQRRLFGVLRVPWFLATSEDFRYPETEGNAMNAGIRLVQRFIDRMIRRSVVDQRAYEAFLSVMHMTRGPEALFAPAALRSLLGPAPREMEGPVAAAPPAA